MKWIVGAAGGDTANGNAQWAPPGQGREGAGCTGTE